MTSVISRPLKVGVVGATGMVGQSFMSTLEQRKFPVAELRPFASEQSLGKSITLFGKSYPIQILKPGAFDGLDVVFFSSGDDISKDWAPQAVQSGAWVIDNSAAFRMDPNYDLVVPEVNGHLLKAKVKPTIVANPNCSTIQLVVALNPILSGWGLTDVKVASYQAVSGAGSPAQAELLEQAAAGPTGRHQSKQFPHPIAWSCIPQIGGFGNDGFCSEETKIMNENRKILNKKDLKVSAFTVRIPAWNGHSEAVWFTTSKLATYTELANALKQSTGIVFYGDVDKNAYPTALMANKKNEVFIGRLHQDLNDPQTWLMWVVADNLRKGAATNGLQIAERIFDIGA